MSKIAKITLWIAFLLYMSNFLINMYNVTFKHTHSIDHLEQTVSLIVIYWALTGKRFGLYLCFIYSCMGVILTLGSFFYPDIFSVNSLFNMSAITTRLIIIIIHTLFALIIYYGAIRKKSDLENAISVFKENIIESAENKPYWYWDSLYYPCNYQTFIKGKEVQIELNLLEREDEYLHISFAISYNNYTNEFPVSADTIIYR